MNCSCSSRDSGADVTPIRVLVVDDSVVVRRLVTTVLDEDDTIEVVGTAANGEIALDKIEALKPDIVTLDIEMPVMNGIETLRAIRQRLPRLPVIMFSTLTESGAAATLDCLASGANDFVTKPANVGSVTLAMQAVRAELIPKVKVLCGRSLQLTTPVFTAPTTTSPLAGRTNPTRPRSAPPLSGPSARSTPSHRPGVSGDLHGAGADRPVVAPAASRESTIGRNVAGTPGVPPTSEGGRRPGGRVSLVVIGVSTGGPNALADIWPNLPKLGVPILIVQHMPPVFTTMLASRLDAVGTVPVAEAVDGTDLMPGRAWLAPGDHHMVIERAPMGGRIRLNQDPHVNSCRPAVDPLFDSAAAVFGAGVLSVVLTGMGNDGTRGAAHVLEAGGTVIAQDEATSVVWGMPGSVVAAGLASAVVPLSRIAAEIAARVGAPTPRPRSAPTGAVVA